VFIYLAGTAKKHDSQSFRKAQARNKSGRDDEFAGLIDIAGFLFPKMIDLLLARNALMW